MKGAAISALTLQSRRMGPSGLPSTGRSARNSSRVRTVYAWNPNASATVAKSTSGNTDFPTRSEEHTSELQSHSDLVCRLLLEKKKKQTEQKKAPQTAQ